MSNREDDDSDAPEEVSLQQGKQQNEEIRKLQQQSKLRVQRERKERRKKKAERLAPKQKSKAKATEANDEMVEDEEEVGASNQSLINKGMLPNDIVNMLAAREKQVFLSDSEDEKEEKRSKSKKKKAKTSGVETVVLKELPPTHCVQNSLEFLKKRKTQVPRSAAVLTNSNQALRLLSSSGILK